MIKSLDKSTHQYIKETLRRGLAALSRGQIQEASDCCQAVLKIKPDLVQGHFLVGLVALESKNREIAFSAFKSVTKLQSNHSAAWAQLAKLYMGEGQVNAADAALQEAIKHEFNDPMVYDLIGTVYSLSGEYGLARTSYEKAMALHPNHPPYMLNYANNLVYHGKTTEAEDIYRQVIAIRSDSPQAHWQLSGVRKVQDPAHIEQMARIVEQGPLYPRAQAFYYYAMGKEYEDLQQWDFAFEALSKGAKCRRETVEFDETAEIEMFQFLEDSVTNEWFDNTANGNPDPSPIFVLGQPRTGTTLVERIISSHSQVHSAGELQQFGLAIRRLSDYRDPKRFSTHFFKAALNLDMAQVGSLYLQTTQKMRGNTPRFVDKLPQNYLMIPLILKALPNAKIVHLNRGPMDACFASFKQLFADAYLHSYEQREMARHHIRYRRLMDIWRQRFPDRFFDISYEATANKLEHNVRALIDFIDLPWEEACLNFHQQDGAVSTASAVQVREPAHTRSIGRWRKYEQQLEPMLTTLRESGLVLE